jgi:hypothetical protein
MVAELDVQVANVKASIAVLKALLADDAVPQEHDDTSRPQRPRCPPPARQAAYACADNTR